MSEPIVIALITATGTLGGAIISYIAAMRSARLTSKNGKKDSQAEAVGEIGGQEIKLAPGPRSRTN
jgi:hypothetical protein